MFNWLTPNVQKGIAFAFVFSWYLAQRRFEWFWAALSGQATLGSSKGVVGIIGTPILPDLPAETGGGSAEEPPPTEELPPGESPGELPPGGELPEPLPGEQLPPELLPGGFL